MNKYTEVYSQRASEMNTADKETEEVHYQQRYIQAV
jgi:hypothetical protein